jgi:hypothetical protein
MPYPAGYSACVKKRIIDSARKSFNRYGFDSISTHSALSVRVPLGLGPTQPIKRYNLPRPLMAAINPAALNTA